MMSQLIHRRSRPKNLRDPKMPPFDAHAIVQTLASTSNCGIFHKGDVWWIGQPIRRVLSSATVTHGGEATIHLRTPLPTPSSSLPRHSGEQPSIMPCLALLRVGFT